MFSFWLLGYFNQKKKFICPATVHKHVHASFLVIVILNVKTNIHTGDSNKQTLNEKFLIPFAFQKHLCGTILV